MPIPFLLGAAAVVLGGYGIKKGVDARQDNKEAQDYNDRAEEVFDKAQNRLDDSRERTLKTLENMGELKLNIWKAQFSRYVKLMEQIHQVELPGPTDSRQMGAINIDKRELAEMERISIKAGEVLGAGVAAIGSGALAGVACYGGAMTLATASTGTAIASLSGVAATNATLAWFGGGSLAAGGLGIAGGTAVLGGIVAAPVLAVAGMVMAAKAQENLANARKNYSEAKLAAEEMNTAASKVDAINNVAGEYIYLLDELDTHMTTMQNSLEQVLTKINEEYSHRSLFSKVVGWFRGYKKFDYRNFDNDQKQIVHMNYLMAQIMKKALETPILNKDGSIEQNCRLALDEGKDFIASLYA